MIGSVTSAHRCRLLHVATPGEACQGDVLGGLSDDAAIAGAVVRDLNPTGAGDAAVGDRCLKGRRPADVTLGDDGCFGRKLSLGIEHADHQTALKRHHERLTAYQHGVVHLLSRPGHDKRDGLPGIVGAAVGVGVAVGDGSGVAVAVGVAVGDTTVGPGAVVVGPAVGSVWASTVEAGVSVTTQGRGVGVPANSLQPASRGKSANNASHRRDLCIAILPRLS